MALFQNQDFSAGEAEVTLVSRTGSCRKRRQTAQGLQVWNGGIATWKNGTCGGAAAHSCWYQLG